MIFKSKFFRNVNTQLPTIAQSRALLDSFPEPRDDIDRTAFQYRCRFARAQKGKMALFNLVSFAAVPCFLALYLFNRLFCRPQAHRDAVLINEKFLAGMSWRDKLPEELSNEFGAIFVLDFDKYPLLFGGVLDKKALGLWWRGFVRHPFACFLNLMSLVHIGSMTRILTEHTPRAVINYMCEFNFVSSMLTELCESHGCEYICFMHGDYLADENRAFVRYSRLYLWDEHYRKVFDFSRCAPQQYRFYHPAMYDLDLPDKVPAYDLTYYFSGNDHSAGVVLEVLRQYTAQGKRCKVRPHPRYTDIPLIRSLFEPAGILVEAPLELSLEDSVADSRAVAARCSTVLTQAYYAGKEVYIDDLSDPSYYAEMKERMFIMTGKPHRLLSELYSRPADEPAVSPKVR